MNWEAKNVIEIKAEKAPELKNQIKSFMFNTKHDQGHGDFLFEAYKFVDTHAKEAFLDAKVNAKLTGKLLACALASQYPFKGHAISLVGYSLGAQVVKSCLKTLHEFGLYGQRAVIDQVTLLASAMVLTKL